MASPGATFARHAAAPDPAEPKAPGEGGQAGDGNGMKGIGFRNDSQYKGSSIKLTEGPTLEIKDGAHGGAAGLIIRPHLRWS